MSLAYTGYNPLPTHLGQYTVTPNQQSHNNLSNRPRSRIVIGAPPITTLLDLERHNALLRLQNSEPHFGLTHDPPKAETINDQHKYQSDTTTPKSEVTRVAGNDSEPEWQPSHFTETIGQELSSIP
jgi:hypothetical protein